MTLRPPHLALPPALSPLLLLLRLLSLLLLLVLALALPSCVPSYEARLAAFRAGGDLAAAEALLDGARRVDPDDAELLRESGIVALERGNVASAAPLLARAHALAPADPRALFHLALAEDALGHWERAADLYRRYEAGGAFSGGAFSGGAVSGGAVSGGAFSGGAATVTPAGARDLATTGAALHALLVRQRHAVLQQAVEERVEQALAGHPPVSGRVLILPFDLHGRNARARALRLGLSAVLIDEWRQLGPAAPPPVPLAEVLALLARLDVAPAGAIDAATRARLVELTGAATVLYGQLSELSGMVALAPSIARPSAGGAAPRVTRVEYLRGRVESLLDLEKTLLVRLGAVLQLDIAGQHPEFMTAYAAGSAQALERYGAALAALQSEQQGDARRRAADAVVADPGFTLARELRTVLDERLPPAVPGETGALRAARAAAQERLAQAALQDAMLVAATENARLIHGPEGESADLSVNRPAAAGSAAIVIRMPR